MPDIYLSTDLLVLVTLLGLGLTVLLKNRTAQINRVFAMFVSSISVWIMANYISNDIHLSPKTSRIATYLVFFFSFTAAIFLLNFVALTSEDKKATKHINLFLIPALAVGITAFSPLVVGGVSLQGSVYAVKFGPFAPLYFLTLILITISSPYVLFRNIKKSSGDKKARLVVLSRILYVSLPILIVTQFVLPTLTGWFGLTNIGTLSMLVLVFGLYYGVVKHKLFDLKLLIIRSLAYVLSLGILSAFYGVTSFYITTLIAKAHSTILNYALNVLVIIVVITVYSPMRRQFNKLSNKFFYQDAYDVQELYDQLNKVLVSTLDLDKLLYDAMLLIVENIKSDFCFFSINGTNNSSHRFISDHKYSTDQKQIDELNNVESKFGDVVAIDYLEVGELDLRNLLEHNKLSVLVRLKTSALKNDKGLGIIGLGNKKSGNPYSDQDLRVLDTVAKELIIAIQNAQHFEEIQNFNVTLQDKVDQATHKLRKANEKLRALDESKDDFISMASHQLRTPLTSIKGYISMVLEGDAGKVSPMQHEMLGQAFFSSQRMVYLISDLLNVSRLKTGKFIIERNKVNLATMVAQELDQLKETASARQLTLTHEAPKDFPDLMLDETKTRQVIMNFVDNAIYYTPAGGHINVKLIDNPNSIELRVIDDGIGVSKADQHHLFTKFYRAGNARKARPDGTGLGLFMAKKVIIAEEGSLIFESTEGKGSTFGFVFYKSKASVTE